MQNVPVMGYYHWSLVDNFEWAEGWNLRFGLIEVNPETQERKLRRSGELYAEICKTNTITSDMVQRYTPELMRVLVSWVRDGRWSWIADHFSRSEASEIVHQLALTLYGIIAPRIKLGEVA